MGEEHYLKRNKKIIKVRRLSSASRGPGPSHKSSQTTLTSQINSIFEEAGLSTSEQEEEIQVIELDRSSSNSETPIEFLFPKRKQESLDINFLAKKVPATDITKKLLIGEKAQYTHLRQPSKRRHAIDFSPLLDENDSEGEEEDEYSGSSESTSTDHHPLTRGKGQHVIAIIDHGSLSADADVSDDESAKTKNEQIRKP